MTALESIELKSLGYCIIPDMIGNRGLENLRNALDESFEDHRQIQLANNSDIITEGIALHVILDNPLFLAFLEYIMFCSRLHEFLKNNYFKSNFILNSFSGLNNLPNQPNFSSMVHRDLRFYTGEVPMMLNMLIMVDDFTEDNGPTLLLPYSHLKQSKPTDEQFHRDAIKATGKAGSILLFDSNIWHASSLNTSNNGRRAIAITFTKSLIKQLLDYPRALGYSRMESFSESMQQLLGYYARVPANLDEWYQPFDKRFYKKNQD